MRGIGGLRGHGCWVVGWFWEPPHAMTVIPTAASERYWLSRNTCVGRHQSEVGHGL